MYKLVVHNDIARFDLPRLMAEDVVTGRRIATLLQQLQNDQDKLDRMSTPNWGGSPARPIPRNAPFNVKMWRFAQDRGMNLWRLRDYLLVSQGREYRLVYAFFPQKLLYVAFAVVEKEWNYDPKHAISQRIFNSYNQVEYNL
ncbi:hypothetical protein [Pseudomonas sp. zfem003]|uniref:hypothetical protein n=1 Tax=Pseudomonas sp. zfem003 TaxID=3078198 RepID=UPI002927DA77|nr:hypothetical protein [Pseudomonas sp. zfem003]MDU9399030.1 hypothetical protein [Pseudomonas sp. zfem003]